MGPERGTIGALHGDRGMPSVNSTDFESIRALSAVGIALSAEKDERRLMELIVQSAKPMAETVTSVRRRLRQTFRHAVFQISTR